MLQAASLSEGAPLDAAPVGAAGSRSVSALRQARRAMGRHGWSQLQLIGVLRQIASQYGQQLPSDASMKTMLSKWENGHRTPDDCYGWLLCQALRSTPEELRIPYATPPWASRSQAVTDHGSAIALLAPTGSSIIEVTAVVDGKQVAVAMDRRTLLQAILAVGAAGPAAAARPARVDPAVVEHFARLRAVLVDADNTLGPRHLLATVTQQLAIINDYRRAAGGRTRTALLATQARWAEFAGWLADDCGDMAAGSRWTDLALRMSSEAEDQPMVGYIRARQAQRTLPQRDAARILAHADAALQNRRISPLTRAFGLSLRAHGEACAGDLSASEDSMAQAYTLASRGQDADHDLGGFCLPAYLRMREADCWLDADRPERASTVLQEALAEWPLTLSRDRGLCLARLAVAHFADGQPEKSAATARQALEVATATGSARIHADVNLLAAQLSAWHGEAEVDALLSAVTA